MALSPPSILTSEERPLLILCLANLIFSHTLLGDFLDQPELETAMWGLLSVADRWDDELQPKFGGKRSSDG